MIQTTIDTRRHGSRQTVSLVVPFYNEGAGVEAFHAALEPVRAKLVGCKFEIVCVDDGSEDDTLARLHALAAGDHAFRVIELSRNFGKEAALTAGLDEALGDAVVVMDADLQDPPTLLPTMVARWLAGADVVLARRADRSCDGWLKRVTAAWFYRMHNAVSDIRIPPDVGDFRLMDRAVVEALKALPERQRFMKGLFCWVGFHTEVLDCERAPRAVGDTKFSGWRLWNFALEGFTSFSTAPLRMWTYLGVASAAATSAYAFFIFLRSLFFGTEVPGYASLLLVALFFGSVQLISLGLLGEYIGRIYNETKQRPIYVVRSRYAVEAPGAAQAREPLVPGLHRRARTQVRTQSPRRSHYGAN